MKLTEVQENAKNIHFSTCVTASAGTGKTALLAERYITCLVEDKNCEPSKILCLTFTDKATAEIREKIEKHLHEKWEEERAKGNPGNRYSEILEKFPQCRISTFHGFCSLLLREFALDAGIQPGFTIMDEIETAELIDDSISSFLSKPPAHFHKNLVELYLYSEPSEIAKNIKTLIEKWRILDLWYQKFLETPEEIYNQWVQKYHEYIFEIRDVIIHDERIKKFLALCEASDYNQKFGVKDLKPLVSELESASFIEEIISIGEKINSVKLDKSYLSKLKHTTELPESELSYFKKAIKLLDISPILEYMDDKVQFLMKTLQNYCSVASEIHRRIEEKKRRRGLVNFDDLIDAAKKLMKNEEIVHKLQKRFMYILVDEVQDNDPALTEIVTTLAGDIEADHKLFIVGDIKQSIYKFRGADPDGALDFFKTFHTKYELDICFRSLRPIVEKINKVFTKVFPTDSKGISYSGIDYNRKESHGSVQIIRNEGTGIRNNNDYLSQDSSNEATMVASWIHRVVKNKELKVETDTVQPARYGDMVILLDRRTRISALTSALDTFSIPYREYKGRSFYTSQEIIDITNVLKAVIYQEDDIALYGALVSPYFGISAETLSHYRKEMKSDSRYLYQRIADGNESIQSALNQLQYYRELLQKEPLGIFLHHLVQLSGITSVYSAENDGDSKLANLEKYLDIASQKSLLRPISPYEFLNYIHTSITREVKEEEGDSSDEGDAADVVKIMTVHASKGLQFPVVILMFSGRGMRPENNKVYVDKEFGIGISPLKGADGITIPSYSHELQKQKVTRDVEEERKRIFYVAATRARDHLIISETEMKGTHIPTSYMDYYRMGVSEEEDEYADTTIIYPEHHEKSINKDIIWNSIQPVKQKKSRIDTDTAILLQSGSCMHEIFEGGNVRDAGIRYGMPKRAETFEKDYQKFLNSEFMKDVTDSKCELEIITRNGEYRRLDRLVRKTDGSYLIIDYKEGKQSEQNPELLEEYKKKLIEYADAAEQILHQKVPAYLYFVGDASTLKIV